MMFRPILLVLLLVLAPLRALAAVDVQEVTSPGGISAWLVEEHSLPFVAIEIRFRGGAALDAPGKRGAVNLMTGLLEEGAAGLDARGFAARAEELAARFRFRAFDDVITVSAQMLTENRADAADLLRAALVEPAFDADAIARVKDQVLVGIQADSTNPAAIARRAFYAAAFGDHPYGTDMAGTEDSLAGLTREDLFEAHRRALARDRVFVAAVGDITAQALGQLLDRVLGDLPAMGAPPPPRAEYLLPRGGHRVVPFDTPQSIALFGHQGITRDDPDFMAAYVVNEIFGGSGFTARLMQEVREKRGLTYGVGTFLSPMEYAELILGSVRSDNATMARAVAVIRAEWARMADEGVTAQELADAKTYLTGAYALRFDGNAPIARVLVGMQLAGLPADYIRTRNARIEALTLSEVNRVARRIFDPDALHFVIVGQPEGLD